MRFIEVHKITADRGVRGRDFHTETDEPGENAQAASAEPEITSVAAWVNIAAIRCFYARRDNRPGTRITFTDGGGYAVTETVDEVMAMIGRTA